MDKIERLLDAIEHPERYSDAELEAMLTDSEVTEVYDLLSKVKSSLTPIPAPDVDAEWKEFDREHRKLSSRMFSFLSRNVAASIAIGIASLAAVAAVVGVTVNYSLGKKERQSTAVVAVNNVVENDSVTAVEEIATPHPEIIVFDNEPLEDIIIRIAEYYGCKCVFSSEATRELRLYFQWNQAQTLDEVVESLNNFEQIHITVKDKTIKID